MLQTGGFPPDLTAAVDYTRGFTQEMVLTETMMKQAGLQPQ